MKYFKDLGVTGLENASLCLKASQDNAHLRRQYGTGGANRLASLESGQSGEISFHSSMDNFPDRAAK